MSDTWTWELRVPLRISRSTKTTFLCVRAKLIARLMDTNVLPAPGLNEVNITTCMFFSFTRMKSMLVRTIRNASETESRPFSCTTTSFLSFLSRIGISPKNGTESTPSTSFRERTFVSLTINSHRIPAGIAHPNTTEANRIIIAFGATGALLPAAGSMIRALLSVIRCVSSFSSRLFNR